ncbi:alkaline phosphatase family protein [Salinisphaera sp.]|uniref:phospholipase C n=1 Tax=Salinisphaera sp. TaxID=1914330 RepID=UPI002D799E7A|nr:alkaline phosphatase family protein [Salinisphaera sp.]HET7314598.1 alkaline phosphatase family protein [Salinisphaera sp.]
MTYLKWATVAIAGSLVVMAGGCDDDANVSLSDGGSNDSGTSTPIEHLVVIFPENVSFDHYFGTYPNAANPSGEPKFIAAADTPEDIDNYTQELLNNNPNLNPANGDGATNPFRLDRSQALTADQHHDYEPEQLAFNDGAMDLFPKSVGHGGPPPDVAQTKATQNTGLVMGYYDGNTVTALWNYAQQYAMSDNSYGTNFGPSTPGAINLISGQTNGIVEMIPADSTSGYIPDGNGGKTLISDPDPIGDVCSGNKQVRMGGPNIGDMLNNAGVTWGWFEGGFDLTVINENGTTGCERSHHTRVTATGTKNNAPVTSADYIPHHEPFQYYASTANPEHKRPSNIASIGHTYKIDDEGNKTDIKDPANHQYDSHDFFDAVKAGNFPAVSFLKAPAYEDGHAGYSDPIDEQHFIVKVINFLQRQPAWKHTAVIIAYDDSDGWYDHRYSPNVNPSSSMQDALNGAGTCESGGKGSQQRSVPLDGIDGKPAQGRCGYGPRLPLLVISPWAKHNFVDHTLTDQTSIMRFIEDNWLDGKRLGQGSFDKLAGSLENMFDFDAPSPPNADILLLDPDTGLPQS